MREEVNHDAENRERRDLSYTGNADQLLGNKQTTTNGWTNRFQISLFSLSNVGERRQRKFGDDHYLKKEKRIAVYYHRVSQQVLDEKF